MGERVALLTRVSTEAQAEARRHSLDYQREHMEEVVEKHGWNVVRVYEIPGESAFKWNLSERPQFRAAIEDAARREFEILMVYDLSRFARNQAVLHSVRKTLMDAGVQLWVATGGYDAVQDSLRSGLEGIVAEQSSRDHSRRLKAAYAQRHARGYHTGDLPFAYSRGVDGVGVPISEEAEAVKWAFRAFVRGVDCDRIAHYFNEKGFRPRSRVGHAVFSITGVQSILENRYYTGVVTHLGHETRGLHVPILSENEWMACANMRIKR